MKHTIRQFLEKIGQYNKLVDDYTRASKSASDPAMAYVNWGIDLAGEDKIDEAMEKFYKAVEMSPDRAEPWTNLGVALAKQDKLDEAIDNFKKAISIDPEGMNNYMLWAAALVEKDDFEGAEEKYKKAMELADGHPEPYVNWGTALARKGKYNEAIQHFKDALVLYGAQPDVFFLWGVILAETHQYHDAIEKFKATLRFVPSHADSYHFWSVALKRLGKHEDALEKSRKAIDLRDNKPEYYLNQGDILANLNRLDVAISNYKHALTLNPDYAEAHVSLGVALCKTGEQEEGYQAFSQALGLDENIKGVHRYWGEFLLEQGRYDDALTSLEKAFSEATEENELNIPAHTQLDDRQEEAVEILINWAMVLMKLKRHEDAVEKLLEAEKRDRWHPQIHYLLGTHFLGGAQYQKAVEHLEKALTENQDFDDAAINLSLALCEIGQAEEAVRRIRPIIRNHPDSARFNFFYGTILFQAKDYTSAQEKYEKALALKPDYPEPVIGLAELHLHQSRYKEAGMLLTKLLEDRPTLVPALFLMGVCSLNQALMQESDKEGCLKEALQSLNGVIAEDETHLDGLSYRAFVLAHLESIQVMNEEFDRVLVEFSHLGDEAKHYLLANWAYFLDRLGENAQAEEKRKRAEELFPEANAEAIAFLV